MLSTPTTPRGKIAAWRVNHLGERLTAATLREGSTTNNTRWGRRHWLPGLVLTTHPQIVNCQRSVFRRGEVHRDSHGAVRHTELIVKIF